MKRRYLFRLIMIMMSLLLVAVTLLGTSFWKNSLNELRTMNDAYYQKILDAYAGILNETVTEMRDRAAFISAESKESDSALFEGVHGLEEDYYRIYLMTQELEDMNPYINASDWGIYLYESDKILKPSKTTNVQSVVSELKQQGQNVTELSDFFAVENYRWAKETFCTTKGDGDETGSLIMGVCTHIGTYHDKALVYFVISAQNMEKAMTVMGGEHIGFHLYDEVHEKVMLSWGNHTNTEQKVLHTKKTALPGLSIIAYLSEDILQQGIYEYASNMVKLMTVLGIVLFFCCLGGVYLSYKPIRQLTNGLEYEKEGEIHAIMHVMERDRSIIEEQEDMITDLLLSHLLYGGHISSDRIKHLGIKEEMKYYCVFLLSAHIPNSNQIQTIESEVMHLFDSHLSVIDLPEEDRTVFVVFSKTEEVLPLYEHLKQWLVQNDIDQNKLYFGKVVDNMDDIQSSFRTCLAKEKRSQEAEYKNVQESAANTKDKKQKQLTEEILSYLELHYRDANLGQVQVADEFQISNYTLSRMFKSQVGIGFTEYLIAKRLDYAKELLLHSDYSINDIAAMSGFASVHYFSRMFKATQNVTPSAFRKDFR